MSVKMRGLPFTTESITSILGGQKTQTRRIMKIDGFDGYTIPPSVYLDCNGFMRAAWGSQTQAKFPYGKVGDRLYVKESLWVSECGQYYARQVGDSYCEFDVLAHDGSCVWLNDRTNYTGFDDPRLKRAHDEHITLSYSNQDRDLKSGRCIRGFDLGFGDMDQSIDIEPFTGNAVRKEYKAEFRRRKSSRFMPKWASRIFLEIVSIRAERVNEISPSDCRREGIKTILRSEQAKVDAFKTHWDSINAKRGYSFDSGVWVWVIEFKQITKEEAFE